MLLIKKSAIIFTWIFTQATILAMSIYGYLMLSKINKENNLGIKYLAENYIYYSMIILVLLLCTFSVMFYFSYRVFNLLDKISKLSKDGNVNIEIYIKKLGVLGEKINNIISNINDLNLKKSVKISSLSKLNEFLVENFNLNMLLLDFRGIINFSSKEILKNLKVTKDYFVGKDISEIVSTIDFEELYTSMGQSKKYVFKENISFDDEKYKGDLILIPIINQSMNISNIVCLFENKNLIDKITNTTEQITEKNITNPGNKFFNFIKNKIGQNSTMN